jgi:general secretion pathway protein L
LNSVGIDIGSYSIKIAEVETVAKSFFVRDYLEITLNLDPEADRKIQIIDALRRVASHYSTLDTRFVLGIRQEQVASRHKVFPFKEKHKILKSLPFELEEEIPLDAMDAIFDARLLGFRGDNSELLAVACPHESIQETLDLAHDAGIEPDIISVDGLAISNCFTDWANPPQELAREIVHDIEMSTEGLPSVSDTPATMFLDIGHSRALLNCYHTGRLLVSRTLPYGGHTIAEAIAQKYGLPYLEAIKGLQEKGFLLTNREGASEDQIAFSDTISTALEPMISELRMTLIKIRSEFNVEIGRINLLGGVSRLLNVGPFLTQQIGIATNPYDYLSVHKIHSEFPFDDHTAVSSAPAIGLAIEALRKPRNPAINFRKLQFGRQSQTLKHFWEKWSFTVKLAAVALFCIFIYAFMRSDFADTLSLAANDALKKQAKTPAVGLKGSRASVRNIKKWIRTSKKDIKDRKQLAKLSNINSVLDVVLDISKSFPGKNDVTVDVRRVYIQNENVTIEGEVSQRGHVQRIKQALTPIASDRKVLDQRPSIKASAGKLTFALNLKVSRRSEGDR